MACREIYIPKTNSIGVIIKPVEFTWYPGYAIVQKQKSIDALHESAKHYGIYPTLEISTKSKDYVGRNLSAFNLSFTTLKSKLSITVEAAFQGSKVFENGGPYEDLYTAAPGEAKRDPRLKNSGNLIKFLFKGRSFGTKPKTFFYDWLYINTLNKSKELLIEAAKFKGFTDIEFNPKKSLNCQAYSVALAVSLYKAGILDEALKSPELFNETLSEEYSLRDREIYVQENFL